MTVTNSEPRVERTTPQIEDTFPSHGPVAYLTGEYPKVSHTFILREIQALRAAGVDVASCTVRRPAAKDVVGEDQRAEAERTFCIMDNARRPHLLLRALIQSLIRSPKRFFSALALAWRTRSPGLRALLWQFFYFAEAIVFAAELHRIGARHIHNHFADSSCTVTMLASELSGIPFSFTPHGPAIFFEPKRWRLDEKVARASFVACISHFARSQTMLFSDQQHWHKLHVIHCGVIPENYGRRARSTYGKHVVFVGRLAAVKGVPLLLEAIAKVRDRHPDIRATIVGDGSDRVSLEAQSARFGLDGVVQFVGYQSQQAVGDILERADMLVLPSFAEGVPVVLMEAMASRLTVISSSVGGVAELVEDGVSGVIVPPGDITSLSAALDRSLSNPERRASMGAAGRAKVELEFNIHREARRLQTLFGSRLTSAAASSGAPAGDDRSLTGAR